MFESIKRLFKATPADTKPIPRDLSNEIMAADTYLYPHADPMPYNPDKLAARKGGLFIYDKMRRDDAIKACLNLKKYAVLSSGWNIEPASEDPTDIEIADFVKDNLKLIKGSFDDVLLQIMTAFEYGFSVTEKSYKVADRPPYNGKIVLHTLKTRKPHGIDFATDRFGNLKEDGVIQARTDRFNPDSFIIFTNNFEFDNLYGESDLRACYRAWWSKDNIIKFWNIFLERYGMPPAIGKITKPLANPTADKAALQNILKRLQAATSAIIPNTMEIDFPEVKGNGAKAYEAAIQAHDMAIARSLLVPSLLGITAQGNTGSYSQSKTHFDVFIWVILKIRRSLEELLFENLIRQLVDYNFRVTDYPKFKFLPLDEDRKIELSKLWIEALKTGAATADLQDENLLRKTLGWPEKQEEQPKQTFEIKNKEKTYGLNRKPNKYEKRVDFKQIEKDLDQLEVEAKDRLVQVLTKQRDVLISFLQKKFDANAVTPKLIKSLQLKYLKELQQTIKEVLREAYRIGQDHLRKELNKKSYTKLPPFYSTEWLNNKSFYIKGVLEERLLNKIKGLLLSALETGEPTQETMLKIEEVYRPYIGTKIISDTLQTTPWRIETLIRTNVTGAFNQGRIAMSYDKDLKDYIQAWEFSAILDSRTTEQCRHLDGKIIRKDDPDFNRIIPPLHWNCRSSLVPVTTDEEPFEAISRKDMDKALQMIPEEFGGRIGKQ